MEYSLQVKNIRELTNSSIATVDGLVRCRSAQPHYGSVPRETRLKWLVKEISLLATMRHQSTDANMIIFDAVTLDEMMAEDPAIMDLTQAEISESFRKGLCGAYGEFYGLTSVSLFQFLSGFMKSEKKMAATKKIIEGQKKDFNEAPPEKIDEYKRIAAERKRKGEPMFQPPQIKTADEIMAEERVAHRLKIEQQAKEIYREYGNAY